MADLHLPENTTPPTTPLPSMPLHLSGFLHGDTIQVEGDANNLQFSLQFSIQKKHVPETHFRFMGANSPENDYSRDNTSFSSYKTPNGTREVEDRNVYAYPLTVESNEIVETVVCDTTTTVVTRLRSGVISPVKYFPRIYMRSCSELGSGRGVKLRKKCGGRRELLKSVLRRHSLPVRPCSSYTFFVMATWGLVKSSSFGEASKTLGQMWCRLPYKEKRVSEDMALKDSARYKRQCMLLSSTNKKRISNRRNMKRG